MLCFYLAVLIFVSVDMRDARPTSLFLIFDKSFRNPSFFGKVFDLELQVTSLGNTGFLLPAFAVTSFAGMTERKQE